MKEGGSELGCVGNELRWVMSCDEKLMLAVSVALQAVCPLIGDTFPEMLFGVCDRERSLGSVWERGTQLRVYMVRSGIS
jgi:hypothetical protein